MIFLPPKLTKSIILFRSCWVPFWTSSGAPLLILTRSAPPRAWILKQFLETIMIRKHNYIPNPNLTLIRTLTPPTVFLPPSWRHAHAHFGFAHRQQPLRWLKPFLKHWYVKLKELIAPHTLKWINSIIKLGHFVWNIIYCLSRMKFKDRWVVIFIYDSFCWTKSPTAASLGSRNDAM